ncbi:MAG: bifunctional phosphopantothenoylcysteine decarboxylase/phosphopantothenate--cysteine ligase CoaBC [Myxococcota bacterium]
MSAPKLRGRRILVAVSGGIGAYKAVLLVRELLRRGAEVRVAMTEAAKAFVGPMTFAGLTGRPAATHLWDPSYPGEVHVELGEWAELIVVMPVTQHLIARAAHGMADDLVSTTLACAKGSILFAPAMHHRMWNHPATQANVATLRDRGTHFVGPVRGVLASGEVGDGRMSEPLDVANACSDLLSSSGVLRDRTVLLTAGPTVEDLDPVRFLSNRSSGRMGYALADAALRAGARVILVSGPVTIAPPPGAEQISVRSAREMRDAVMPRIRDADIAIFAAAVADYRPKEIAKEKIKKAPGPLVIELERNPDILAEAGEQRTGRHPVLVGFAAESSKLVDRAREKLRRKRCDLIVANLVDEGFEGEESRLVLVDETQELDLGRDTKAALAGRVVSRIAELLPSA